MQHKKEVYHLCKSVSLLYIYWLMTNILILLMNIFELVITLQWNT